MKNNLNADIWNINWARLNSGLGPISKKNECLVWSLALVRWFAIHLHDLHNVWLSIGCRWVDELRGVFWVHVLSGNFGALEHRNSNGIANFRLHCWWRYAKYWGFNSKKIPTTIVNVVYARSDVLGSTSYKCCHWGIVFEPPQIIANGNEIQSPARLNQQHHELVYFPGFWWK